MTVPLPLHLLAHTSSHSTLSLSVAQLLVDIEHVHHYVGMVHLHVISAGEVTYISVVGNSLQQSRSQNKFLNDDDDDDDEIASAMMPHSKLFSICFIPYF